MEEETESVQVIDQAQVAQRDQNQLRKMIQLIINLSRE